MLKVKDLKESLDRFDDKLPIRFISDYVEDDQEEGQVGNCFLLAVGKGYFGGPVGSYSDKRTLMQQLKSFYKFQYDETIGKTVVHDYKKKRREYVKKKIASHGIHECVRVEVGVKS